MTSSTASNTSTVSAAPAPAAVTAGGPLAGRVAVVTGATSGIGAATARRLALGGASVALLGRREDRLRELAGELRPAGAGEVLPVAADLADPGAIAAAAASVRAALGRVDLVVANAGVMLGAPFETADTAEWDRMLDVNLRGLLHTGRVFADDLLAAARSGPADLVHVGSVAGHSLYPDWSVYSATKAAVAHLTRNLRAELGPRDVRVHNVEPGVTVTELGADMRDADMRTALDRMRTDLRPLSADDIAQAIAFSVAAPAHVNIADLVVVPVQQG
ncbi:SDR family oxidoreductase [Streptomyces minutiscleroticus]|uniref:Aldehyde dehydrogenase n=1 Tax=Streptomyces minutiscleroticus TaxID=68238 RepID=A0A918NJS7_9ACTN|nr:SDR family oxidoreductase [Streptomyces minutiscleroticus]GGX72866.1 aldehyde dehydrogenase [Streptomyces minutiscleroticus]